MSCFFPPIGGGGVQRIVKLLRYLPRDRWVAEVLVLSPPPADATDPELLDELPPDLVVHRVPSPLPTSLPAQANKQARGARPDRLYRIARTAAGLVLVPDIYLPWALAARRPVSSLLRSDRFDVVVSTSPPDSAHVATRAAVADARLPWVADFRDPWTRRIHFRPPTPLHRAIDRHLEARVVRGCDAMVMVTEAMRTDFARRYPPHAGKMRTITNGFDPADYPAAAAERGAASGAPLRLLHTGTLTLRRNIAPLASVLDRLRSDFPDLASVVRVDSIGGRDAINDRILRARSLEDLVTFHPTQPHREIVRRQREADALLLVDAGGEGNNLTLPGKLFEYLGARRPVFALASPEATGKVLRETGAGICFAPEDVEGATSALKRWIGAFHDGSFRWQGREEALEPYTRPRIATEFAAVLEQVTEASLGSA